MSVENPETAASSKVEVKPQNGEQDQRFNGLSNGHIDSSSSKHKSSKDKHRDKDREHKSSKSNSSGRDKESEKHKSSSSSDKDKHREKERSDKDRQRHKDRDKDKDKERHRDKDRDKHKSSSSSHHKSSGRDKEREKEKTKDRDREKDREREKNREREKDKEKDKIKDKEKEKQHDKDKEKHKDRNENEKDKERRKEHKSSSHNKDRERDRDRERSDKNKDHHKSSSSSKSKHSSSSSKSKDKDKDRHSSSKDKERHKDKEKKEKIDMINNKDMVDCKANIKIDIEPPRNDYDQSCSGFPMKGEECNKEIYYPKKEINENKTQFKEETMNFSQASSCDYSMSQFRDDEPAFVVKEEMPDETQEIEENQENNENGLRIKVEYGDEEDEEDVPLAKRKRKTIDEESEDDIPLVSRKKVKIEKKEKKEKDKKAKKKKREEVEDDIEEKPKKKKIKKEKEKQAQIQPPSQQSSPTKGRKKKEAEPEDVWKWWEEEKRDDGVKWTYLEHRGPVFAPPYDPLPENVRFYYDGKAMKLSRDAEEVASFYAKMLTHDYVTKKQFNDNFFKDWRKTMTSKEREIIRDLTKCNFKEMNDFYTAQSEKRKSMSKEEKLALKEQNEKLIQDYGYCIIDGHKQRIGNFKLEPPGLFRGRGEHPKMGLVKRRLLPEDILINCSKNSKIPEPPKGHKWKEVRHDNTVTWLASWTENVQGQVKYIMLNPSSKLKGEKDYQKYEVARRLDKHIDKIRSTYRDEWKSKEMRIRQRGVALYFIDKLALRAGNEKDEDQADTVGCCSLRVEHVQLHKELNGKENVVVFDFLGKDSIRYYNEVEVEKRVFKNLELFMENKKEGDDLFDRLNTMVLNEHLRELMEGLTAKVFRTYNASITLQRQLDLLTDPDSTVPEKLLSYNRANRAVAVLCNHQRSIPKSHEKSMENLKEKIRQKREAISDAEKELRELQKLAKRGSVKEKLNADKKKKQVERLKEQLKKLELQQTDRDENKTIALGTSKLNYLDPRISVAWCKKHGVPIEKIFNKTQREKFRWAIDMAEADYRF